MHTQKHKKYDFKYYRVCVDHFNIKSLDIIINLQAVLSTKKSNINIKFDQVKNRHLGRFITQIIFFNYYIFIPTRTFIIWPLNNLPLSRLSTHPILSK